MVQQPVEHRLVADIISPPTDQRRRPIRSAELRRFFLHLGRRAGTSDINIVFINAPQTLLIRCREI
jgi:hypothetical protein